MEATTMWVDIGKQESRGTGMDAQIYLVNSMKKLLIPLDDNSTCIQHLHTFRSNMVEHLHSSFHFLMQLFGCHLDLIIHTFADHVE